MRIALHSEISAGDVDAYRVAHERIPEDLRALFDRVGITDWTIWRSGTRLFHLVECDDFERALAAIEHDPANVAWQANIGRFVDHFSDLDGDAKLAPLELVWSLEQQRASGSGD